MKSIVLPVICITTLLVIRLTAVAGTREIETAAPERSEIYLYEASPVDDPDGEHKESIQMQFVLSDSSTSYIGRITRDDIRETVRINMRPDGEFISAARVIRHTSDRPAKKDSIWRAEDTVYVGVVPSRPEEFRKYVPPDDKPLAVDASLLVLLRSFPFNRDREWKVFMIDFSRRSITVTVRQSALENVVVPAGEFECYRIEVIVSFLIFRTEIVYWISTDEPHFLVKHRGKRGPFTSSYVTSLLSVE